MKPLPIAGEYHQGVCRYMQDEAGELLIVRLKEKYPDPDLLRNLESFREECLDGDE